MAGGDARMKWIEAALSAVAAGGVEQARVEVLAQTLGVTKGGFYWHFKDRRDLLDAILETWREGRIAAIEKQAASDKESARDRLRALIRLYTERVSMRGMAIEMAIRQWAKSDKAAAAAVENVDTARLYQVTGLFEDLGLSPQEAEARALLFYSFIFGQSLLFMKQTAEARKTLTAACAAMLIDVGVDT